jgi:potassium/hydrogen antiporter
MITVEPYLLAAAVLVLVGVAASKLAGRLGVPSLLLFLAVGMLAGSDGPGRIAFADVDVAQAVGVSALALILFDGGISTRWSDVRPVLGTGVALATLGVVVTAGVTGVVASWALGVPLETGLLLGAIVSSTDAAAVFSVLRSRGARLRSRVAATLELESGSNDPMAVFLTLAMIEVIGTESEPGAATWTLAPMFVQQLVVGTLVGLGVARAARWAINRSSLGYEGLYPVVSLAVVLLTYSGAAMLGGSGFLAVYLCGLVLGNGELLHRNSLLRFHDAIAWLAQIGMFLVLGLLVFPSDLADVAGPALLISAVLILVARPLATVLASVTSSVPWRERLMVSWVGLRGAVPIILATFPLVEDVPEAALLFDVVFFVVLTSILVQGTTIPFVADRLRVTERTPTRPPSPLESVSALPDGTSLHEIEVRPGSAAAGCRLVELGLPGRALVVLVNRGDAFLVPQGATALEPGDVVLVLADDPTARQVGAILAEPAPDGDETDAQ